MSTRRRTSIIIFCSSSDWRERRMSRSIGDKSPFHSLTNRAAGYEKISLTFSRTC